jgi:hypothetical protein
MDGIFPLPGSGSGVVLMLAKANSRFSLIPVFKALDIGKN